MFSSRPTERGLQTLPTVQKSANTKPQQPSATAGAHQPQTQGAKSDFLALPPHAPMLRATSMPETTMKGMTAPPKASSLTMETPPARLPSTFPVVMPYEPAPLRGDNTMRMAVAEEWVDAHDARCKPVAEALMRNIQHVDIDTFLDGLYESVTAFEANLPPNEKYVALVEPRRGSGWVFQHAADMLTHQPELVGDVDQMYGFAKDLSPENPMPRHLAYFDDASYSGEQLFERLESDIIARVEPHVSDKLTVHVVVPFMTDLALRKLESMQLPANVELRIAGKPQRLHTIGDLWRAGQLTDHQVELIRKMYPEAGRVSDFNADPLDSVTLAYMAHKVPDGWSCLSSVLRAGEVRNESGMKMSQETYQFVPKTIPPYRSTKDW